MTPEALPLYRRLIVEGAWWDLVDEVATHLICDLVVGYPDEVWPAVDTWIDGDDMWLRRSAIICQVSKGAHRCRQAVPILRGTEFREGVLHPKGDRLGPPSARPCRSHAVARFVMAHRDGLSGLSYREATRHIGHLLRS